MQYEIIRRTNAGGSPRWVSVRSNGPAFDANARGTIALLDEIVAKGWEVVAVGDISGDGQSEILIRSR